MRQIRPSELARWLLPPEQPGAVTVADGQPQLVDVREPWEVAICALNEAIAIPMNEIPARLDALDPDRPVVCICHHGMRSLQVAHFLERRGFTDVINLAGGIDAWAREVDPSCPTY